MIDKIYQKDNYKYFFYNDDKYYIIEKINNNIYELIKITNYLFNNNVYVYTFIINNENKYITSDGKKSICLLRVNNIEKDFSINYISKFQNIKCGLLDYDILNNWKNEVDSLEKEMIEYNKEYIEIQNSINYFIGMAENAIELLGIYKNHIKENNDSIGHIMKYNDFELDNPFTFIKTNKMYDIANYIKYNFIKNKIDYNEIERLCSSINNEYEIIFLFSNLLYPNIYFDLVKNILISKEKEDKIKYFLNNIKEYKELLKYIQDIYKNVKNIRLIAWLSE